jgi:hypothetical protein
VSMLSSSHSGIDHDIRVAREPSHLYLMKELIRRTQAHSGALRRNQAQSVAISRNQSGTQVRAEPLSTAPRKPPAPSRARA